ncbi:MAG: hypothetical protein R2695_01145 [Acidimicrobiales bacterium]
MTEPQTPTPVEGGPVPAYRAPHAEALLRQAIDMVREARPMPLSASSMINKEELLAILESAAQGLPEELRSARWLLKERDDFLARVQREGDEIIARARTRAEQMVQRTELVKSAEERARRVVADAEERARDLRLETEDWCDQKLGGMEVVLERTMRTVASGRARLQGAAPEARRPLRRPPTCPTANSIRSSTRTGELTSGDLPSRSRRTGGDERVDDGFLVVDTLELRRRTGSRRELVASACWDDLGAGSSPWSTGVSTSSSWSRRSRKGSSPTAWRGRWTGPCRCLDPIESPFEVEVREIFQRHPTEGETWPIDDDRIDRRRCCGRRRSWPFRWCRCVERTAPAPIPIASRPPRARPSRPTAKGRASTATPAGRPSTRCGDP